MKLHFGLRRVLETAMVMGLSIVLTAGALSLSALLDSSLIPKVAISSEKGGTSSKVRLAEPTLLKFVTELREPSQGAEEAQELAGSEPDGSQAPSESLPSEPFEAELVITDRAYQDSLPAAKTTLSNGEISWLYLYTKYEDIEGSHKQKLNLYAPGGYLYRTLEKNFETGSLPQISGFYLTEEHLPFGSGTWTSRLTGRWTVKLYLDGSSNPSAQTSFTLTP